MRAALWGYHPMPQGLSKPIENAAPIAVHHSSVGVRKMFKKPTMFTAIAMPIFVAGALGLTPAANAQAGDAKAAQSQVSWALSDLDPLLAKQNSIADEGDRLNRWQLDLRNSESQIGYDISNFNSHCTGGRWANPCPGWQRKIDTWQVGFERDLKELNRKHDALTQRSRQLQGRIEQMRSRLTDSVGQLLSICRQLSPAERSNHCSIPSAGRYTGQDINRARRRLRAGL